MNIRNISSVFPYFDDQDIDFILHNIKDMLKGNSNLSMGKFVRQFEEEFSAYIGSNYGIATNSCTTALETVLMGLNLDADSEVIVPVQTFIATASSVVRAGGKIVFADTDDNFQIDIDDLKRKINPKTKAVIIVHYLGLISEKIFEIKEFLSKKDIFIIEDCSHAHGAMINGIKAGNIGDAACFSFYSTKIITTGEGGMITTNRDDIYEICSSIRNRGIDVLSKQEIYSRIGSNFRMTEMSALLGIVQLRKLEYIISYRNKIAELYKKYLSNLEFIRFQEYETVSNTRHSYWRFLIFIEDEKISRDLILKNLIDNGVPADTRYTPLLHQQPVFKDLGYSLKNAESLSRKMISLPVSLAMKEDDVEYIYNIIKRSVWCYRKS